MKLTSIWIDSYGEYYHEGEVGQLLAALRSYQRALQAWEATHLSRIEAESLYKQKERARAVLFSFLEDEKGEAGKKAPNPPSDPPLWQTPAFRAALATRSPELAGLVLFAREMAEGEVCPPDLKEELAATLQRFARHLLARKADSISIVKEAKPKTHLPDACPNSIGEPCPTCGIE